jgi:hypothetical protein
LIRDAQGDVDHVFARNNVWYIAEHPANEQRELLGLLLDHVDTDEMAGSMGAAFGRFHPDIQNLIIELLEGGPLSKWVIAFHSMTGYTRELISLEKRDKIGRLAKAEFDRRNSAE